MDRTCVSEWRSEVARLIARIDAALERQVNAILHHPRVMEMEARWRGLALVVRTAARSEEVKVRIISASRRELERSLERAGEFDQSHLFELVYSREFGTPGGEPFGLLVADYMVSPDGENGEGDTVGMLTAVATVAAAAFCPVVAGASARTAGLGSFRDLNRVQNLAQAQGDPSMIRWTALRSHDDARFLGLVAPRVLLRPPHRAYDRRRDDGFPFRETIAADASTLLWGNGAFAFAVVVIRTFIETGWFADLRGVSQDRVDGGMLGANDLSPYDFGTESGGLSAQPPVEARLTIRQAQQLSDLGIVPIETTYLSSGVVFNSNQSLHAPPHHSSESARQNARLAAMLQYVLCASRFSHYLKVILRDEIGRLSDAATIQRRLADWLAGYTLGNDDASSELRTRFPLRSAGIEVGDIPGKPGSYMCTVRLQPHFQLDDVTTSFHLVAETEAGRPQPSEAASQERIFA
ncbi:type VI secretion system contractile sheath large subunit [Consotaella aegiceratis]|uniref:type VI secretion system contractile sheath large subunit n=1 Tax=Consotaella aegiceratis TaxID=3097961 RepID=UPI002F40423F